MSRFFINRPIFASVISIIIVIAGLMAARSLPIAQYPEITPPTVVITASYPGASAETLARTVAGPIEEQLSGVENLLYFNSSASSNGSLTITASFEVGTNVDMATVNVNNRVKIAEPRLPDVVRQFGVTVQKRSNDILMITTLTSPDASRTPLFLSNYALVNVVDDLKRIPGVGDAQIFGALDYSIRLWLKPDRMAQLGVTATDIANAVAAQNRQNAAGKIGQEPAPAGQQLVYTVTAKGRLSSPEEFGNIVVRAAGPNGVLRVKDVARVELGAQNYDASTTLLGKPVVGVGIFLQSGANALEVANKVRARMDELKQKFPTGVDYVVPFDTTKFVQASINEVVHTLIEALVEPGAVAVLESRRAVGDPVHAGEQRVEKQHRAHAPRTGHQCRLPPRLGVPAGGDRAPGDPAARVVVRGPLRRHRGGLDLAALELHLAVLGDRTRRLLAGHALQFRTRIHAHRGARRPHVVQPLDRALLGQHRLLGGGGLLDL